MPDTAHGKLPRPQSEQAGHPLIPTPETAWTDRDASCIANSATFNSRNDTMIHASRLLRKVQRKVTGMPISTNYLKPDGARFVLERAGIDGVVYWSPDVERALSEACKIVRPQTNTWVQKISEPPNGPLAFRTVHAGDHMRSLGKPTYLNVRPDYFPDISGEWPSREDPYKYAVIDGGYFAALPDIPTFFTQDRQMLDFVGSKYRSLINYYDIELREVLDAAPYHDCTALVIADDIWDFNYCHWLCDWLPRLALCKKAFPGERIKIVTAQIVSQAQRDSLKLLGFAEEDIIPFQRMQAGQFKRLIAPNDLGQVNHPAHKGALWALDYLKTVLDTEEQDDFDYPENIYVSRKDAPGRKLVNEEAFVAEIEKLGFKTIVLSEHPFLRQAKLFRNARKIIGLHGAGLTNIVFSTPATKLLEVTPATYGMPTFFILAGAQGMDYAVYVTPVEAGVSTPFDNMILDIDDLLARAKPFFGV